ncbi:MAG: hypothetical protein ACLTOX_05585 [Streptococcus thermophilus]
MKIAFCCEVTSIKPLDSRFGLRLRVLPSSFDFNFIAESSSSASLLPMMSKRSETTYFLV